MIQELTGKEKRFIPIFYVITGIFLFLSVNNKTLLVIILLLLVVLWLKYRDWLLSFWLTYLVFIPFEKGKSIEFTLIPASLMSYGKPYLVYLAVHFSDLLFLALVGILVWYCFRLKKHISNNYSNKPVMGILILLFLTFCLISVAVSNYPLVSTYTFIRLLRKVAVFGLVITIIRLSPKAKQLLPYAIAFIVLFQGFWATAQFLSGRPLGRAIEPQGLYFTSYGFTASEDNAFFRASGTMDHPNSLGLFLAMGVLFMVGSAVTGLVTNNGSRYFYFASIIFGALGLIFSGSRVGWVVFLLGLIPIMLWVKPSVILQYFRKRIWLGISSLVVMAYLIVAVVLPRIGHYVATVGPTGGVSFRTYLIQKAIWMVNDSPFGVGLGTYPAILIERFGFPFWPTPVHNLFFEILAEAGVFALILMLLIIIRAYIEYFRVPKKEGLKFGALLAVSGFIVGSQFYPFFTSSWLFEFFWLMMAVMLY